MIFTVTRSLRTSSSERFLLQAATGQDIASLDIHYLDDGGVAGTLILLNDSVATEAEIEGLLQFVDTTLLPMASLNENNLSFTVLRGHIIGQVEHEK